MFLMPARDEAPRVGAVVRGLRRVRPDVPVVVVENGSTDATAQAAARAGATVLHAAPGYARALKAGFRHALAQGAPWVLTVDADGQHPPDAVPALLAALEQADLVVGSRFLGEPGYRVPLHRAAAIHALGAWASFCAGQRLSDVTSGMRALRPAVVAAFAEDYPEDVADANVLVRAVRRGFRVVEVGVPMRPRPGGRSMHDHPGSIGFALRMALYTAREGAARTEG